MTYNEFIDNVTEPYGRCAEVTQQMVEEFPELMRVRGHYYDLVWGEREHWWCVDPFGEIVDPTKDQFPTKGTGEYVLWVEGTPEPTGMCPNCGEYCYDGRSLCSDNCEIAYLAYLRGV